MKKKNLFNTFNIPGYSCLDEPFFEDMWYRVYNRGIRRLIPKYQDRTIFTKFFWRTWWDRRTKGFDETCTWSLDYSLAKLIVPRLKAFIDLKMGLPSCYISEVTDEMIAKGKKYDFYKNCFIKEKDKLFMHDEADKRWNNDLQKMLFAFQDIIDENDDWDKHVNNYRQQVESYNEKLFKLKTEKERKAFWNSVGSFREYRASIMFDTIDFADKAIKEGLDLFAKHFQQLWW